MLFTRFELLPRSPVSQSPGPRSQRPEWETSATWRNLEWNLELGSNIWRGKRMFLLNFNNDNWQPVGKVLESLIVDAHDARLACFTPGAKVGDDDDHGDRDYDDTKGNRMYLSKLVQAVDEVVVEATPQRYLFYGSTRYYTIFWDLIRLSHNISDILWLLISAKFVKK